MVVLQALVQQLGAHRAQIPGEDAVVVPGEVPVSLEELVQAGGRRGGPWPPPCWRGPSRPNPGWRPPGPGPPGPFPAQAHQRAARRGGGPLGSGGALAAVLQRQAELALCRAEVGACHRQGLSAAPLSTRMEASSSGLGHGGAGPVLPQKGDAEVQQPKGGGDALVEQIPRQDEVHLLGGRGPAFSNAKVTASFWRRPRPFPSCPPGGWCPQRSGRNRRPGDPRPPACPPLPRGRGWWGGQTPRCAGPAAS